MSPTDNQAERLETKNDAATDVALERTYEASEGASILKRVAAGLQSVEDGAQLEVKGPEEALNIPLDRRR